VDVLIRPETVADRAAIAEVVERAFGAPAEARLVEAIRASPEYIAELALVAVAGERIVGHVMISRCRLVADGSERQIAILAPLAVEPAEQGHGVSAAPSCVRPPHSPTDGANHSSCSKATPPTTRASVSDRRVNTTSPCHCPSGPLPRPPRCSA
jgi:hypothetical protein